MLRLAVVLLLLFANLVHATESSVYEDHVLYKVKNKPDQYLITYGEENRFFVDVYSIPREGFQERLQQYSFSSSEERQLFLRGQAPAKNISLLRKSQDNYTEIKTGRIWQATQNWSWDWELRYADWVTAEVDAGFMLKYQIRTDCADLAIALRWIFARINGLPAGNQLAGSGALFTNESMHRRWARLPTAANWYDDRRFREALDYLLDNTYTHSAIDDSYPVRIAIDTFLPGVHHLEIRTESGHTMVVSRIMPTSGAVRMLYSNVPRIVRYLYEEDFYSYKQPKSGKGGFLRFRWVEKINGVWAQRVATNMPDYSQEQFDPAFMQGYQAFDEAVLGHLGLYFTPMQRLQSLLALFVQRIRDRIVIVEQGYAFCRQQNCDPQSENYELWSTPSRDGRITDVARSLKA
jgi:hypothetical protein